LITDELAPSGLKCAQQHDSLLLQLLKCAEEPQTGAFRHQVHWYPIDRVFVKSLFSALTFPASGKQSVGRCAVVSFSNITMNNTELLQVRIESLESTFFGSSPLDPAFVSTKLHAILEKIHQVEKEVPNIKACCDTIQKLQPLIADRKVYLSQIGDKVDSLLLRKEELLGVVRDLDAVSQLAGVVDSDVFCVLGMALFRWMFPV